MSEQVGNPAQDVVAAGSLSELEAARAAALDESGWGRSMRLFQPRNLAFWVYVVVVGFGAYVIVTSLNSQAPVYGPAIEVAGILFGLYGGLFWWFTHRIDRYAGQSNRMVVLALVWGAFGALIMASFANTPIMSLYGKAFGAAWSSDWGAGLTAPFVEELAKGAGLLLLIALGRRLVATAFDGFILGAFIGLGFQIQEDIQYALGSASAQFGADPVGNAYQTIVLRVALGFASHVLYSAIFCAGLVYFLGRPGEPRRRGRGLLLMLISMVLHGIWDSLGGIVGRNATLLVVAWVVMTGIGIFIATRVFRMTVPRERAYMRAVLAPEAAAGVITAEELDTVAGDRRARRAYDRAAAGGGDRRHRHNQLEAVRDLADELARSSGASSDRVQFARAEVARLRTPPHPDQQQLRHPTGVQ